MAYDQLSAELLYTCGVLERIRRIVNSHTIAELIQSQPSCFEQVDIPELNVTLSNICAALQDVHQMPLELGSRGLLYSSCWVRRSAYDIEDSLDAIATNHLKQKRIYKPPLKNPFGLSFQLRCFHYETEVLLAHLGAFDLRAAVEFEKKGLPVPPSPSFLHTNTSEDTIVGSASEKEEMINFIFRPSNQRHPNMVFVGGDSGIGKTTLVRAVCNDVRVSTSFGLILWASDTRIGSFIDLGRIIVAIIQSATSQCQFYPKNLDMKSVKGRLRDILRGQKYLLVLDDFQVAQPSWWEELRQLLEVGSTGSTVILTSTCMEQMPAGLKSFRLKGLTQHESWSLFTNCAAFDAEAERRYPYLEQLGRSIVQICNGNPLAVKIFGRALHSNRDERSWAQVIKREKRNPNPVNVAVRIGFENLPRELMPFFCAILPDKVLSRDQLVYLWMAQGLLPENEELGEMYCNELLLRGFLQTYHNHHHTFQMHSKVQEFARIVLQEETKYVPDEFPFSVMGRNVQWKGSDEEFDWDILSEIKARSLYFKHYVGPVTKSFLEGLISALKRVRVLFLDHSEFEELPESIGELVRLRYLSLAGNRRLQVIPTSIRELVNLQTLDLSGCQQLEKLPQLVHGLRHLLLSVKLTSLPTEILDSWTTLRHLKICNCQNLKSLPEETVAELTALRVLRIHDCPSIASLPNTTKYLSKLEELSILNCQALDLTEWDGLDGLTSLRLLQFQGIPQLANFPEGLESAAGSLRILVVRSCINLKNLPACLFKCNNLLELLIDGCPNMVTLPTGIQAVKTLRVLKISNCPELAARFDRESGQDWHLISHIPKIQLDHPLIQNLHVLDPASSSEIEGKGGGCVSLSHEGLDKQEVDIEEVHDHNINLSSPDLLQSSRVEMVRDGDRDAEFTPSPPPPPPPPPSFHQDSGLPSTRKIRRNRSQGAEYNSKLEKNCFDQLPDLVVPSNDIESFSKGILFLLGEGCEFEKEKLVQLWMALGFINDEINGPTYFETLVSEGYILLSDSNTLYKVNAERVNSDLDIIRDKSKYLILESTNQHNVEPEEILHVSVVCDEVNDAIFKMLGKFNKLVTLLFHGTCGPRLEHLSLDLFLSFKSLLVLDLSGTDIKELPSSIGKMVHLRYLDLSWTLIELLPESVSCLQRLQTLRLKGCSRIRRLPRDMKMLTELRHLEFNVLGQLTVMPKGLSALIKLRTLSSFLVGTQKGFDIRELGALNNLAGEFCIARLENVKSSDDAKSASISSKSCLTKLELRWSDFPLRDLKNEVADDTVLENLRPPSDLEELRIRCYAGTDLPSWIADESFHRLARITLFKCEHVSMLPSLQTLPSVEYLELISLNSVIQVDVRGEIGHVAFPRLQTLVIDEMLNLKTWTEARECDFPCLVELTIKGCPNLSDLPSLLYLSSMKRLEMSFCPQVQFLPDKKLSTSLEFLIVYDCPLIKESCWEQGGRQWELIKHVPNIWIDQEEILGGVDYDSDMVGAYDHYGIETDDDDDDDRELLLSEDENEK